MKKIKISELPLYNSLKGLFAIGTDNQNRSVKVSLEFVEQQTTDAVTNAQEATEAAKTATQNAQTATGEAKTATKNAVTATEEAQTAKKNADSATEEARKQAQAASEAAGLATTATSNAQTATQNAEEATEKSKTATGEAQEATEEARNATQETLAKIAVLVPTGMTAYCPETLTYGNVQPVKIDVQLSPETAMKNIIYVSDNRAVEVGTDGILTIIQQGTSRVHVIPTMNTSLASTFLIQVVAPRLRLVTNRAALRFTQSGALRLS